MPISKSPTTRAAWRQRRAGGDRRRLLVAVITGVTALLADAGTAVHATNAQGDAALVTHIDDTGTFSIGAPAEWDDVSTVPTDYSDGSLTPKLVVAPDVAAFLDGGPGVYVSAIPTAVNPDLASPNPEQAGAWTTPDCVAATPPTPSADIPAVPNNVVGTWTCGDLVYTGASGVTADGLQSVFVVVRANNAIAPEILRSLAYLTSGAAVPATTPPTLPVEAEGVTIVEPGDPAAAVVLRHERTVGERATIALDRSVVFTSADADPNDGSPQGTTSGSLSLHLDGSFELTDEQPNGEFGATVVPSVFTANEVENDSGQEVTVDQSGRLVGVPLRVFFGPGGEYGGVIPADGTEATAEQQEAMNNIALPLYVLPSTPVGVGATWTGPMPYHGMIAGGTGTASYHLDAIDGDQFTVSFALDVDLSTMPLDPLTTSMTGTAVLRGTIAGSLSTPSQVSVTTTLTIDYVGTYTYGVEETLHWEETRILTSTPV